MNVIIHPPALVQTELFKFTMATGLGEEKVLIQAC